LIGILLVITVLATGWLLVVPIKISMLLHPLQGLQIGAIKDTIRHRGSFGILVISETTVKVIATTAILVRSLRRLSLSVPEHEN
jgi:hypothetical protein